MDAEQLNASTGQTRCKATHTKQLLTGPKALLWCCTSRAPHTCARTAPRQIWLACHPRSAYSIRVWDRFEVRHLQMDGIAKQRNAALKQLQTPHSLFWVCTGLQACAPDGSEVEKDTKAFIIKHKHDKCRSTLICPRPQSSNLVEITA